MKQLKKVRSGDSIALNLILFLTFILILPVQAQVSAPEKQALLDLYNSTGGANWNTKTNWLTGTPVSDWYGITVTGNKITAIQLDNNNLIGVIPSSISDILGLESLSLNKNKISGNIPTTIGDLVNLKKISLYRNQLTGAIPASISKLSKLTSLSLYLNKLDGDIPLGLGDLLELKSIHIGHNKFQGSIPVSLGNLSKLTFLYLTDNKLEGGIPMELGNMSNIQSLSIADNNFSGVIPNQISNLVNLRHFRFRRNGFVFSDFETEHLAYKSKLANYVFSPQDKVDAEETLSVPLAGSITLSSAALTSLNNSYQWYKDGVLIPGATTKDLVISNATNADAGVYHFTATNSVVTGLTLTRNPITLSIGARNTCGVSAAERQMLVDLYNSTNGANWTNTIANNKPWLINDPASKVCDWYGVTVIGGKVVDLILENNNLVGEISTTIVNLTSLRVLNLIQNSLGGAIPNNLNLLVNLQHLRLRHNQLTGSIPRELGQLSKLIDILLGFNRFTGTIPKELGQLTALRDLRLNNNELTGTIPNELGQLLKLETALYLYDNKLTGTIPSSLGGLTLLQNLRLGKNQLTGSIPLEIKNLSSLKVLTLGNNKLTGSIPDFSNSQLTRLFFENNDFVFNDFESGFNTYQVKLGTNFRYVPQGKVDQAEVISVVPNGSITLSSTALTSLNNSYQWYKDGILIPGASSKDLVISNATNADAGVYHFTATNSVATGLTLTRNPITLSIGAGNTCGVSAAERQALIDLYNSTDGANWRNTIANNRPWLINDPASKVCDWAGITVENGKVTKLSMVNNGIKGGIPESFGNLVHLTFVNLSINQLSGPLPVSIGNLVNASTFTVERNAMTGIIPSSIGNMRALSILNLGSNQFSGGIPVSLQNLTNLTTLNLFRNALTGSIPAELGSLLNLEFLNLFSNQLTGAIPPSIGNLSKLKKLMLYINRLEGPIPSELGNLLRLEELHLERNVITGSIPISFGNLSSLHYLNLGNNSLSGSIPKELGNLSNLTKLYLFWNKLEGELPLELGNLQKVTVLNFTKNLLNGVVPSSIGQLPSLTSLYLGINKISGNIPTGLTSLASSGVLKLLSFESNNLVFSDFESGFTAYTSNLTTFTYLTQDKVDQTEVLSVVPNGSITLSSTALTSLNNSYQWYKDGILIPGASSKDLVISNATNADAGVYHFTATNSVVTGLTLTRNPITLSIEAGNTCGVSAAERQALIDLYNSTDGANWRNTIANNRPWLINDPASKVCDWAGITVENGKVTKLSMVNNGIKGGIPESFGNLVHLTFVNLSINQLSGPLPVSIGNLVNASTFTVERNAMTGIIPSSIGNMRALSILNLGSNQFSGGIPVSLQNLTNLTTLNLFRNALTGSIPAELGSLLNLEFLNLFSNQLTGAIPPSIGNLSKLKKLMLYINRLEGPIPSELGNLLRLEELHLERNVITGSIPISFGNLSSLHYLNLGNNSLSGSVPKELGNLSNLTKLYLFWNKLEGELPLELGNLQKVTVLNFTKNLLTGVVPSSIGQLPSLTSLYLGINKISGNIPTGLTSLASSGVLKLLSFESNNLVFSDFESGFTAYTSNLTTFTYLTQGKVDQEEVLSVVPNGSITLSSTALTSLNNSYQWYKDGVLIPGATNKDLVISNATNADAGIYHFTATNSVVTGLTLTRNPITLEVTLATNELKITINTKDLPNSVFDIVSGGTSILGVTSGNPDSETLMNLGANTGVDKTVLIHVKPSQNQAALELRLVANTNGISNVQVSNGSNWLDFSPEFYRVEGKTIYFMNKKVAPVTPFAINLINGVQYDSSVPLTINVANGIDLTGATLEILPPSNTNIVVQPSASINGFVLNTTLTEPGAYKFILKIQNTSFKGHFLVAGSGQTGNGSF